MLNSLLSSNDHLTNTFISDLQHKEIKSPKVSKWAFNKIGEWQFPNLSADANNQLFSKWNHYQLQNFNSNNLIIEWKGAKRFLSTRPPWLNG